MIWVLQNSFSGNGLRWSAPGTVQMDQEQVIKRLLDATKKDKSRPIHSPICLYVHSKDRTTIHDPTQQRQQPSIVGSLL